MKFSSADPVALDLCQHTLRSKNRYCAQTSAHLDNCSTHSHTLMTVRHLPIQVTLVTWQPNIMTEIKWHVFSW